MKIACIYTGKKINLQMHSVKDKEGFIVGWVFVHENARLNPDYIRWDFTDETFEEE